MSLSDAVWGYCRWCNREVELGLLGFLIAHGRTAPCPGSGRLPTNPPGEGDWTPPEPVQWEPGPVDEDTPPRGVRGFWRSLVAEANERIRP